MELTDCMGTYEAGNPSCDGEQGKVPECVLRELCSRFRNWCAVEKKEPEVFIAGKKAEDIERMLTGAMPTGAPRKRGVRGKMKIPDECRALLEHFENMLRDRYGDARVDSGVGLRGGARRVVFLPGTFFKVDWIKRRKYVDWYCKGDGQDAMIVRLHLRLISGTLDVRLPYTVKLLERRLNEIVFKKLAPEPARVGQFQCICKRQDREGVGLVVGAIKFMDMKGEHPLPKPE